MIQMEWKSIKLQLQHIRRILYSKYGLTDEAIINICDRQYYPFLTPLARTGTGHRTLQQYLGQITFESVYAE